MALDDLKETIETLRERIQAHRPYLAGYETRTRQALIDPMLRALGWDVEDPNAVELEYGIKRKWADYALMESSRSIAVIEAKALGKALNDDEKMQALNYANMNGIFYMAVTNGDHWQMFDVFKRVPLDHRILMEFQLTKDEPYACALQALALWRSNLASGKPQEAATPVMPTPEESQPEPSSRQPSAEPAQSGTWTPLASLKVTRGQPAPTAIQFPNSSPKPLRSWVDLWVSVAEHLVETDKISKGDCPVKTERSRSTYLLHTEPIHPTGREFERKRKIGNLWLDSFIGSTSTWRRSCWLLEKFGVDPTTVHVASGKPQAAATPVTPAPEESQSGTWTPLTSLKVTRGQPAPTAIQFPNASPKPLRSWVDLWASVAEHLVETDKISERDCPVKTERSRSIYLLHTEPIHPTGREFERKRKIGNLWLRCTFVSAKKATERSRWLLEKFGIDPATVRVSTNQS